MRFTNARKGGKRNPGSPRGPVISAATSRRGDGVGGGNRERVGGKDRGVGGGEGGREGRGGRKGRVGGDG